MLDKSTYGPWAVIAGGSEGVGAAFADELAQAGINLILIARKAGPLEETAESIRSSHGVEVRTLAQDLLADDAVPNIAAAGSDVEVGLFIFNAGANTYGHEFLTGDMERFRGVITLNVDRQLELSQLYGAPMAKRGKGGIILLGSLSGFVGSEHENVYSASKAFSRIFTEGLWLEMKEHGVDVLQLILGVTRTPAMERAGLNFDVPGMSVSEPLTVAREGLEHIADGPVWVADGNQKGAEMQSGFPRDKVVAGHAKMLRKLTGR